MWNWLTNLYYIHAVILFMIQPQHRKIIIVWSTDWSLPTGQAIVTRRVIDQQSKFDWIRAQCGGRGLNSILLWFSAVFRVYLTLIFRKSNTIYLVCSRSKTGFIRDVPALIASLFGVRIVVHVHGSDLEDLLSVSFLGQIAIALYKRCEIIVPSSHLVERLRRVTGAPVYLCENFSPMLSVDVQFKRADFKNEFVIVWNSNIMSTKGFFKLSAAIKIAKSNVLSLRFLSLGLPMGDAESSYEVVDKKLRALCNESWFTYIGPVSPEEAYRWTSVADLYVYPSTNDCQPLALIQAMCLGKPIIANATPPLMATLGDYPARCIANPTPEIIANEIINYVNTINRCDLISDAARARDRFSIERFDASMEAILNN